MGCMEDERICLLQFLVDVSFHGSSTVTKTCIHTSKLKGTEHLPVPDILQDW